MKHLDTYFSPFPVIGTLFAVECVFRILLPDALTCLLLISNQVAEFDHNYMKEKIRRFSSRWTTVCHMIVFTQELRTFIALTMRDICVKHLDCGQVLLKWLKHGQVLPIRYKQAFVVSDVEQNLNFSIRYNEDLQHTHIFSQFESVYMKQIYHVGTEGRK